MSQVKHFIKSYNKLFTLTAVKELTYGGIEHVQSKFEDKYWFEDGLYEESVDEFIISPVDLMMNPQVRVIRTSSDIEDNDLD